MSLDLNRQTWGVHDTATADEKTAATRYVASIAVDAADCRQLLDLLGLLPKHLAVVEHGMPGYRQGCKCGRCRKANANDSQRKRDRARRVTAADAPTNTTTGEL
jgi:hypothetical protein